MPTYVYRAMTKTGLVVKNKVESGRKQHLIITLKNNNLIPIAIEQVSYNSKNAKKRQKKNIPAPIQIKQVPEQPEDSDLHFYLIQMPF